jgi:Fe-Mn family superoxide dismutase
MNDSVHTSGPFVLPSLPYAENALEPVISARTLSLHHGKHHRTYVAKLNELLKDDPLAGLPLLDVVRRTAGDPEREEVFDNAGQAWNHAFYWQCLAPKGGRPGGRLKARIEDDFGSYDRFAAEFAEAAKQRFGSGWAWLVADGGKLRVVSTANAETPMTRGSMCLLVLDVWEHAYYLDYQNRRDEHVEAVIAERLNWDFAEQNYGREAPPLKSADGASGELPVLTQRRVSEEPPVGAG